mmetsp:Transcript_11348/g.22713  ORF Transcript_11348/g.22713 Transcript_11348/m.22713 type:complete len:654 (+) Transcript_11348:54-2015(+)
MGKKKQPFIDKKTASVFHVVRRSQRDVGTEATAETLSDFVLMPSPENTLKEETRRRLQQQEPQQQQKKNATSSSSSSSSATANVHNQGETATASEKKKKKAPVNFSALQNEIAKVGLLDQTAATYSKYTKPIRGSGTYIANSTGRDDDVLGGLLTDPSKNHLDTALEEAMAVHEVGRMLDSIALTPDCMEEDVARALFEEYEEGEFEEILDDFCLTANTEPEEEEGGGSGGFNFEEHIRQLMEKARAKENGEDDGTGRELEDDFFLGKTPLHRQRERDDEDDSDEDGFLEGELDQYGEYEDEEEDGDSLDREFNGSQAISNSNSNSNLEEQKLAQKKFEETLLEYDSDSIGDLDDECEDIVGSRPLEGDAQLEAALDEFLTEKRDEILVEGTRHLTKRCGGSGYSALVGKTMVPAEELNADSNHNNTESLLINMEETKRQLEEDLADADAILANPEMDLPPEEILIDGKSYFSETPRNPWDCESILSTYSNLDNNPVVIGRETSSRRKRRGKKKDKNYNGMDGADSVIPEEEPVKIHLSNKTGLPLGVFDDRNHTAGSGVGKGNRNNNPEDEYYDDNYYGESDTFLSVNRGEARNKTESAEEKKMRKLAIKEERRICRMQKKIMKEAFKEEFQKRSTAEVVDVVGGSTVFRLS